MDKERAGSFKKQLTGSMTYFSFSPAKLPPIPPLEIDGKMIDLLIKANKALAVLDDRAQNILNIELFISMYVRKEALLSSQIEGTQATLEDIFAPELGENLNSDVSDVVNYVKAAKYAIERLNGEKSLPLCNRLLLETHKILLCGVRGKEKNPGEFRRSQNWIGGANSTLKTARYIPPDVTTMTEALSDLEKYINDDDGLDHLIRIALIHYQFETIHPFLDGNGRVGRLLIVLYLLAKGVIKTPSLYLSYYLKEHRIEYYDRMTEIRKTGNYEQWVKFFLEGIYISARSAIETLDELISLRERNVTVIKTADYTARSMETVLRVFTYLETYPMIEIGKVALDLGIAYNTAASAIRRLEKLGILKISKASEKGRNKIYAYTDYLDILRSGTEL
ncbi:MAG: Fic family protein [Eubacteriales bacterium]